MDITGKLPLGEPKEIYRRVNIYHEAKKVTFW